MTFFKRQIALAGFLKTVGQSLRLLAQQIVGLDDPDAFGEIQNRFGQLFTGFLTFVGMLQLTCLCCPL